MSVLAGPLLRALLGISSFVRLVALRVGTGPFLTLVAVGAAFAYAMRLRRRNRTVAIQHAGSAAGTSIHERDGSRPKGLSGVRKVTIGCDVCQVSYSVSGTASTSTRTPLAPLDPVFDMDFTRIVAEPIVEKTAVGHSDKDSLPEADDQLGEILTNGPLKVSNGNNESDRTDDNVSGKTLAVRPAVVPYLNRLAKTCDLYIITRVSSDEMESACLAALRDAGVFTAGMDERKALFCETDDGRVSVVRQLEPHLHIDSNPNIVSGLQRFIKFVALITRSAPQLEWPTGTNVLKFESLDALWK